MPKVLLDTKALWGLIVRDSAYAKHVYEVAKTNELIIPLPAIIEVMMAIYKVFSNHGQEFEKGFDALLQALEKLKHILEHQAEYGIKVKILIPNVSQIFKTIELIAKQKNLFVKKGPKETKWLRIFDAIIATIWLDKKIPLLADDPVYKKISEEYNLQYIKLKKKQ